MSTDEAIKTLKKLGGVVDMNIRDGDLKVTAINLSDPKILDADLVVLKSFPDVEIVRLSGTSVTDACVPTLKALAKLRSIEVNGTKISQAGLQELQRHLASRVPNDTGSESPARRDYFGRQLTWEATEKAERTADNWVVYNATVDGMKWTVRMNDFPAEPLYTLLIDGNETVHFNNWPEPWKRPVEAKK